MVVAAVAADYALEKSWMNFLAFTAQFWMMMTTVASKGHGEFLYTV